ncbi:MAG: CRISPR-associated protein (Cas_Cas5) [Pelotomaculum sp. PtaB.Bin013]|uniref:CRISPR-associated protein Cas5 n=1 Tax=Pelotomaculum isophthalicicum JI TaxID=947010 RepID=A0A9X4GXS2_9FIRM|nr:CRISPR-associated protein Cas5 [Pelotomaculum isophthalicicum]MDF9407072.1 CRISPR-associated protein Cas5 [Pelotomaculum isophthalicicum JI]OPX85826.1 MAG: CRISPR-associated protein (Cas_Cas5) [Pelotomaculum sp. PtaB.Bin013]
MKIISFHLRGKMAHFRRFYSNSSSLSYTIPPRTTITGIVAGLLGRERDDYYLDFSLDRCRIAVSSRAPIKKCMQKLNLLKVESLNDLNGSSGYHSQTATELIIPLNIRTGIIDYQIWLHHLDGAIMNELEEILVVESPGYKSLGISLGLGTAYNLGWLECGKVMEGEEKKESNNQSVVSAIPTRKLHGFLIEQISAGGYRLIKEEIPLEYDHERRITERGLGNMVINLNPNPVPVKVDSYVVTDQGEIITWME